MPPKSFSQRKSPRLQGYDYSLAGAYFITICTHQREYLFGDVVAGEMHLNQNGKIAAERWLALPHHHNDVILDLFVIMPNHMHGIIMLDNTSLSTIVGSYKSSVTRHIRQSNDDAHLSVWQPRFHDHIIRNEADLNRIREYVHHNPARWSEDTYFSGQNA